MFNSARRAIRIFLTLAVVAIAAVAIFGLYQHYMVSPWTRDGQVRAQVANIAPEVAGSIVELHVHDNQFVHKGDLLYVIDKADYNVAIAKARADLASKKADMEVKKSENARRQAPTTLSTSAEEKQQYAGQYDMSVAAYQSSIAALQDAEVNLKRTDVRASVNGYVTNLLMRIGDYANTGKSNISIIDSDSFWVNGYFEETKMGSFKVGDPARVELMGYNHVIDGHVESITRGIATSNATAGTQGLPDVQPVYTWVRLAQRIPVRIKIDKVPAVITLSAGMTATVIITPRPGEKQARATEPTSQVARLPGHGETAVNN